MALLLNSLTLIVTILVPLSSCLPSTGRRLVQSPDLTDIQPLDRWFENHRHHQHRQRQQVAPDEASDSPVSPSLIRSVTSDQGLGSAAVDDPLLIQSLIESAKCKSKCPRDVCYPSLSHGDHRTITQMSRSSCCVCWDRWRATRGARNPILLPAAPVTSVTPASLCGRD